VHSWIKDSGLRPIKVGWLAARGALPQSEEQLKPGRATVPVFLFGHYQGELGMCGCRRGGQYPLMEESFSCLTLRLATSYPQRKRADIFK
jgi:hypothetical protein